MNKKWLDLKKMIEYSNKGVVSKELSKTKSSSLTLFCMAKGTQISEHTSTKKGMICVLEGKGIFSLEGEKIEMLPGIIIFMDKNAAHSLQAKENTAFLLSLAG